MVDFAIVLEPSKRLRQGFKNMDPVRESRDVSYNQTTDSTIVNRPLAVSIETKRGGGDIDQGLVQLSTWTAAQYRRLELLAEARGPKAARSIDMPILPLLLVDGEKWTLYAASQGEEGPVSASQDCHTAY